MLALALANLLPAFAEEPHTPITIDLAISHAPRFDESATVTVTVKSTENAPGTLVEVLLPAGVTATTSRWTVDLRPNIPVEFKTEIVIRASGNLSISARALKKWGKGIAWGEMKTIPLHMDAASLAPSKLGWAVDRVPVAGQGKQGSASIVSRAPTAFSFPSTELQASAAQVSKVSTDAGRKGASRRKMAAPASPGTITLNGTWQYTDRDGVARNIDQQVIEIRNGDGSALASRVFCFTWIDGTYSCNLPTPPGTVRVWVRSWANFNVTGGTNRLGVFSGTEVSGGCGSDSIDCSYPVQTPEVSCSDGSTCDVGTWVVDANRTGEPWLGAHQMTQDLIRSWKKLLFDNIHGSAVIAGPGRINYPVPTGHGTHAHVGNGEVDGWISIEPPNQQSGDISTHEYGHVVMSNLWTSFSPVWPTSDCPSPHFIQRVSAPGCAYSEGWANFWAWYSNEFYDGSNNSANYGPIFNWPGGASTNMETRDGETYDSGDQVEGNVAAALGDLFDVNNDGPDPGKPDLADRVSDGIQHIWHIVSSQSGNNFSDWWNQYSSAHFPACLENDALGYNSIFYTGTGGCPPPPAPTLFSPTNGAVGVNVNPTLSWGAASGATSYDVYFGTSPFPGFVANTGNTFYSPGTLAPATTYFWIIVARNSTGQGASITWSFTTSRAATSTFLLSSLNPSTFRNAVTFTASVSSTSGTPTGTVSFFDAGSFIGSGTLSGGATSFTTSGLTGGIHSITAFYNGDTNFLTSSSGAISQVVNQAPSASSVVSSLNPSTFGKSVTFTAIVSSTAGTPTGTVTFKDGASTLGVGSLSSGKATLTTTSLAAGSHSITAAYGGDTNFTGSVSGSLTETVAQAGTSTSITSSVNPSSFNQTVTFTATVQSTTGAIATGNVIFKDGATSLGTGVLNGSRVATFSVSSLSIGSHAVTAVYSGSANFTISTSAKLTQTVKKANTTTTLTSSLNPSKKGQAVTFTATIMPAFGGSPTGTVTFKDGATTLGTGTVSATTRQAKISTNKLAVGSHNITAGYGGNTQFNSSASAVLKQVVKP